MTTAPAGEVFANHLHLILSQVQQCYRALGGAPGDGLMILFFGRWKMENGWKMVGKWLENGWKIVVFWLMIKDSRKMVRKVCSLFLQRSSMLSLFMHMDGWFLQTCLSQLPMIPCQSRKPSTPPKKTHTPMDPWLNPDLSLRFTITQCHPFHPQAPPASAGGPQLFTASSTNSSGDHSRSSSATRMRPICSSTCTQWRWKQVVKKMTSNLGLFKKVNQMQNETKWDKVEIEWLRGANIVYYSNNSNEWSTIARVNVVKEKQVQGLKCKRCEPKISQKHHSTANPSWISASSNTFWKVGICLRGEIFACASISFIAGICQKRCIKYFKYLPNTHDNFMFFRNQRVLSKKKCVSIFFKMVSNCSHLI